MGISRKTGMTYLKRKIKLNTLGLALIFVVLSAISVDSRTTISNPDSGWIFIIDNSGSMADVFDGDIKLNKAKKAINEEMKQNNSDLINMGLLQMGGHCEVKELVPPALNNHQAILTATNNIRPHPYLAAATPIAKAIYVASKQLKNYKGEKRITLVSDGGANCQGIGEFPDSACEIVAGLKDEGIHFSLEMIGYGSTDDRQLKCLADLSDQYNYTQVNNPDEATKEIEKEITNPFEKFQIFVEQLTELLKSVKELIAIIVVILGIIIVPKGGNDNIQKW